MVRGLKMENTKKGHKKHHKSTEQGEVSHSKKSAPASLWLWPLVCIVLFALLFASILTSGFGINKSANAMSKTDIEKNTGNYLNKLMAAQGQPAEVTVKVINESEGLYQLKIDVGGQAFDSYISKDGKMLFPSGIDTTEELPDVDTSIVDEETAAPEVKKSDKPVVEAFIMSHCPYGTQIEKGLIPVMKTLGDKADIKIKFVYYAMHGAVEVNEQLNQYCIQKEYPSKFVDYLTCFLEDGDGAGCMAEVKITEDDISSCVKETDEAFEITNNLNDQASWLSGRFPKFNIDLADNQKYGVQGSPTLVINGEQVNAGRDAASILSAVCASFNNAPAECDTDLSSYGIPGPGFGWTNSGAASSTNGGCGG